MRAASLAIALTVLWLASACASLPGGRFVAGVVTGESLVPGRITQEELRDALVQYASRFEATVVATADTIAAGTQDPVVQRGALRWKLGVTPVANQAAFLSEPEAAYVALLTLATSVRDFLVKGGGAQLFGEQQQLAVDASQELVDAAIELGDRFLSKKELARVTQDVEKLVAARPMRGDFVAERIQSLVMSTETSGMFDWVTEIPLSPFRALRGVDEGAQAIREFNETAQEMTRTVAAMPNLIRWNLELLASTGAAGRSPQPRTSIPSRERAAASETAQALPGRWRDPGGGGAHGQSLEPLSASLERSAARWRPRAAWVGCSRSSASRHDPAAPAALRHPGVGADRGR